MFALQIQRAAEAALRDQLHDVSRALWAAYAAGSVTEAEAEVLSTLIASRQAPAASPAPLQKRVGSKPRTGASIERRRRWAAAGRLPPQVACKFTIAEQAALSVVALEITKRGICRLAIGAVAAIAGVSETTVRRALRQAQTLALLTVEERRISRWRNETNIISITSREWRAWLRLRLPRGGCQFGEGTSTEALNQSRRHPPKRSKEAFGIGGWGNDRATMFDSNIREALFSPKPIPVGRV